MNTEDKYTIYANGTKVWRVNGKTHRLDVPAIEWVSGTKYWCLNGQYHRLEGPAHEYADGTRKWHIGLMRYSMLFELSPITINDIDGILRILSFKNTRLK